MPEFKGSPLLWLDFDIEARPLSWYGGDWVTKEPTCIAAQFIGHRKVYCWALTNDPNSLKEMLIGFRRLYDKADGVTGHFIRGYDLPVLNGAMLENGLPPLSDKLSHDTKLDLIKFSGLSKSQENLGALLSLVHPKVQMDQEKWREANRLTPRGIALTKKRAIGDVKQHQEMRRRLMDLGLLGPPKVWRAKGGKIADYSP